MGETSGAEIRLAARLTQAERRSTLTHELIHIERRGREHPSPIVEERIVEAETARRLIPLPALVDAFRWHRHPDPYQLAEHLWVDAQTAHVRMTTLDPIEVAELEAALDGEWSWVC